jgi:hypothetical protein
VIQQRLLKNINLIRHEYKMLLGTRTDEVTKERRILRKKELYALYSSLNIIWVIKPRRLRWAEHVARVGKRRGTYRVLVGKAEGRRSLGRHRRKWVDNIKMNFREMGRGAWTGLIRLRIVTCGGLLRMR